MDRKLKDLPLLETPQKHLWYIDSSLCIVNELYEPVPSPMGSTFFVTGKKKVYNKKYYYLDTDYKWGIYDKVLFKILGRCDNLSDTLVCEVVDIL